MATKRRRATPGRWPASGGRQGIVDTHCERLVYAARAGPPREGAVLDADIQDLDELVGFVAAEANRETSRRRQKSLDEAFAAMSDAMAVMGG